MRGNPRLSFSVGRIRGKPQNISCHCWIKENDDRTNVSLGWKRNAEEKTVRDKGTKWIKVRKYGSEGAAFT
jgi:hypothetical protein